MLQQRLTLITLGVEDMSTSRKFYDEIFGWIPGEDADKHHAFYQLPGIRLGLFGRQPLADDAGIANTPKGFSGMSLAYNVASQEEVDRLFVYFAEKNIPIIKQPAKVFWGGYHGYIADPDGFLWEIAWNPFWEDPTIAQE